MKDKLAKKQAAEQERRRNNQSERQRLLREWESDQRGRYQRTVRKFQKYFSTNIIFSYLA